MSPFVLDASEQRHLTGKLSSFGYTIETRQRHPLLKYRKKNCLFLVTDASGSVFVCKYAREHLNESMMVTLMEMERIAHALLPSPTLLNKIYLQPTLNRHVSLLIRPLYLGDNFDTACRDHDFT